MWGPLVLGPGCNAPAAYYVLITVLAVHIFVTQEFKEKIGEVNSLKNALEDSKTKISKVKKENSRLKQI